MAEVPDAGEHHREAQPVCRVDHFLIFHRTAGLNRRRDAVRCRGFEAIRVSGALS